MADQTLKFEVGKKYQQRNADFQRLTLIAIGRKYLIFETESGGIAQRYLDGTSSSRGNVSNMDIVAEYKEPEYKYFNLYKNDYTVGNGMYSTKEEASSLARNAIRHGDWIGTYQFNPDTKEVTLVTEPN